MKGLSSLYGEGCALHPSKQPRGLVSNQNRSPSQQGDGPVRQRMRRRPWHLRGGEGRISNMDESEESV